jgi:hypothetical protein
LVVAVAFALVVACLPVILTPQKEASTTTSPVPSAGHPQNPVKPSNTPGPSQPTENKPDK